MKAIKVNSVWKWKRTDALYTVMDVSGVRITIRLFGSDDNELWTDGSFRETFEWQRDAEETTPVIAIGSVVRLKSGGPQLTVRAMIGELCSCYYIPDYDNEGKILELNFVPAACLELAQEKTVDA